MKNYYFFFREMILLFFHLTAYWQMKIGYRAILNAAVENFMWLDQKFDISRDWCEGLNYPTK
jgi:hypothetical protein